ncbi:MAG TPA: hypothetical protein VIL29_05755 [Pseudothermotoga sp.]|uniref:hypothetical protein n=1 Tax=Thermotoga profunda TaxID=1508420 RepID=UPI000597E3DB|nr:hypothetical protein [Thermotoga profunda]
MKVRFGNIVDAMVGIKEIEVKESNLKKIFESISQALKKRVEIIIDEKEESVYLLTEKDGKLIRNWVVVLCDGVNILDCDTNHLRSTEMTIFVPVSGG